MAPVGPLLVAPPLEVVVQGHRLRGGREHHRPRHEVLGRRAREVLGARRALGHGDVVSGLGELRELLVRHLGRVHPEGVDRDPMHGPGVLAHHRLLGAHGELAPRDEDHALGSRAGRGGVADPGRRRLDDGRRRRAWRRGGGLVRGAPPQPAATRSRMAAASVLRSAGTATPGPRPRPSPRAAELAPAVLVGDHRLPDVPRDVLEAGVRLSDLHPFRALRPVAHQHGHGLRMLTRRRGASSPRDSNGRSNRTAVRGRIPFARAERRRSGSGARA